MSNLVALVVGLPLFSAMVSLGVRRHGLLRDIVTMGTIIAVSVMSFVLLVHVEANGSVVVRVGDWSPDLGIVLVADMFAVLVLAVAMVTILLVEIFAMGQRGSRLGADPTIVGPMLLVLTAGVALSTLTGDLFTLFVAFELMLVASYVLLTHQGRAGQVQSGMTYVVINLFASTMFLFGVAFVYTATGTVNLAELAERIPELSDGVRWGIGLWFLVVFGTKAAMFPLFSWLPDSYPTAPTTITAVFAGLLTKIGVYVMIRFHVLTGMDDLGPIILILAGFTMLVGVAGALAQDDMKRILSFHIVSQIGYMLMGLGLFSVAGIAGAIIFLVHQIPVKTVLFLVGALVESDRGTSALDRMSGLVSSRPWVAAMFALPALSLAGLPPFSGFVAKLALIDAGVAQASVAIVVVALVCSVLTLLSMAKIWMGIFWGVDDRASDDVDTEPAVIRSRGSWRTMSMAAGAATVLTMVIAVLSGPLWDMSERAATELLDGDVYIAAVLDPSGDASEVAEP
ncbi:MAG: proton-conducting transporter membrane subunit [Ilumatobacter sp.]|uniref:proton-conducting transporter transmembrane domain-containing protein n=1 Tax=Ilumatobacter sp. TaxID=1967498 RepID=UPI00391B1241